MKLNSMMKLATVAALVGGTTGCLGTGTDYSYVVNKTADDGAATVTTGSGTTSTSNITFANDIIPIFKNKVGNNTAACINCHAGVLTSATSVTASSTVLKNMGVSSNFMMVVVNPTTSDGKTLVSSGADGTSTVSIGTNMASQFPADPSTLVITTLGGVAGRVGWNCDAEDYKFVKNGGAQAVYPIRAYALAKTPNGGNLSSNLGSRLVEKVGGASFGLTGDQRMPYGNSTVDYSTPISGWEYLSAAQVDTVRTWVANGARCN